MAAKKNFIIKYQMFFFYFTKIQSDSNSKSNSLYIFDISKMVPI